MSKKKKQRKGKIKHSSGSTPKFVDPVRHHMPDVESLVGFVVETVQPGDTAKVLTRAAIVSDMPIFYTYIDQISSIFLNRINPGYVSQFLVLIHNDLSADVFVNDLPIKLLMMPKRSLEKGEVVTTGDIADIQRLSFHGIDIKNTDKVIFCFKVGWKFGLFFDLDREFPLDIPAMELQFGTLYRYLSFQYVYEALTTKPHFDALLKDGWFPFIELIPSEFKRLSEAYKNLPDPQDEIHKLVGMFNEGRVRRITDKWWNKPPFSDKKAILQSGCKAYLRDDLEGFIGCIKTLLTEIEGIIRLHYFQETGKGKNVSTSDLIRHVCDKGRDKTGSEESLLFPRDFLRYLEEVIFPNFDLEKGDVTLSRHSSSHGVAKTDDYTKVKALQMILILDQLCFYI